jgi:hypothetical protein
MRCLSIVISPAFSPVYLRIAGEQTRRQFNISYQPIAWLTRRRSFPALGRMRRACEQTGYVRPTFVSNSSAVAQRYRFGYRASEHFFFKPALWILILDRRLTAVRVGLEYYRSNGTENWDTLQALD